MIPRTGRDSIEAPNILHQFLDCSTIDLCIWCSLSSDATFHESNDTETQRLIPTELSFSVLYHQDLWLFPDQGLWRVMGQFFDTIKRFPNTLLISVFDCFRLHLYHLSTRNESVTKENTKETWRHLGSRRSYLRAVWEDLHLPIFLWSSTVAIIPPSDQTFYTDTIEGIKEVLHNFHDTFTSGCAELNQCLCRKPTKKADTKLITHTLDKPKTNFERRPWRYHQSY